MYGWIWIGHRSSAEANAGRGTLIRAGGVPVIPCRFGAGWRRWNAARAAEEAGGIGANVTFSCVTGRLRGLACVLFRTREPASEANKLKWCTTPCRCL